MKITIFGMAGTGTSSTGKQLARELDFPFVSGGDMARLVAKELGLDLIELEELSKTDKKYDLLRDERLKQFGVENYNCVVEARLGWYAVPDSFKIKLTCSDEVRLHRIAKREQKSFEQVEQETHEREEAIRERFLHYYNMDFDKETEDENFDLVIDTGKHNLEEVVSIIKDNIKINVVGN